jgi:hypothetical protein
MNPHSLRAWAAALLIGASSAATSACYVEEYPEPVYASGYQPVFYDGYMVYYDTYGHPFYYANGAAVWISPSSPYYGRFVAHWNTYGRAYGGWYAHNGYRYHGYRGRR